MKAHLKLGKIFGIEVGFHFSWLIIALLIMLSLSSYFSEAHPDWSRETIWAMAVGSALLFFLAIVIHEFSHAMVARSNGLPVKSITLFALGGVAQIEKEAPDGKTEFWLGIIGPIASAAIGFVCLFAAYLLGWVPMSEADAPAVAILVWLGYINFALAIFNMIPGFPMDGGRVLRGVIWMFTGNASKATRIASVIGQFMAFSFITFGLLIFFAGSNLSGLWMAFIGWFLLNAARASYAQVEITENLRGLTVSDLMSRDSACVAPSENLQTIVDDYMLKAGRRCVLVADDGEFAGLITTHEIKPVERRLWAFKTASDVMRPLENLHVIAPEAPVTAALEVIGREEVSQLPVVLSGQLHGLITREQIFNYLFTRKELNA
ncbi:MAG: site-2 protease family protein [Pyrinomonadaceae bacterium]